MQTDNKVVRAELDWGEQSLHPGATWQAVAHPATHARYGHVSM